MRFVNKGTCCSVNVVNDFLNKKSLAFHKTLVQDQYDRALSLEKNILNILLHRHFFSI